MKKYLLILLLFILACKTSDELNLEGFDVNFNIQAFYSKDIEKYKNFLAQQKETSNGKTKKDFESDLVEEFRTVQVDNVYNSHDEITGIQYDMNALPKENLAYYKKMHFGEISMIKSVEEDFMALAASTKNESTKNFENLSKHLISKYGKPKAFKAKFFEKYITYYWEAGDKLILATPIARNGKNVLSFKMTITDDKITLAKGDEPPKVKTIFFIVNQKYKEFLKNNMTSRSGNWVYLNLNYQ